MASVTVKIKNYQSIEDLTFEVAGFTTISGKTNIGKSAILRAISGALLNKPVTNLVRIGEKSCSVQLSSKTWGLLWEKAEKNLNRYTIDGKAERLENVGQGQPAPVASLGFNSINIGDKDLYPWYATQWSPLFLLDEGGPTVTQFISEISGLNILQDAITLSLKNRRQALDEAKTADDKIEKAKIDLCKVAGLEDLEAMQNELECQAKSIDEYRSQVTRGKDFLDKISNASTIVKGLEPIQNVDVPPDTLQSTIFSLRKMHEMLEKLERLAKSVIALRSSTDVHLPLSPHDAYNMWVKIKKYDCVDELEKSVESLNQVDKVIVPASIESDEIDRLTSAEEFFRRISSLQKSIESLDKEMTLPESIDIESELKKMGKIATISAEIERLEQESVSLEKEKLKLTGQLETVEKELASIPSCPMCKRPILTDHGHLAGGSPSAGGSTDGSSSAGGFSV